MMLERIFCFLPGIGPKSERRLWRNGITTCSTFLNSVATAGIVSQRKTTYDEALASAVTHREKEDARYFGVALPSREMWLAARREVWTRVSITGPPIHSLTDAEY